MYRMIQLASLIPETLPGVALFIKHGENHVLYKDPNLSFTQNDNERLLDHNVRHLFVKSAGMSAFNQYVEANLPLLLSDDNLDPEVKQNMLYQASINYVQEIFDSPAICLKQNVDRCRNLIKYTLNDVKHHHEKENGRGVSR